MNELICVDGPRGDKIMIGAWKDEKMMEVSYA